VFTIIEWNKSIAVLENCRGSARKQIPTPRLLGAIGTGEIVLASPEDQARALAGDDFAERDASCDARCDASFASDELPLEGLSEAQREQFLRITRYIQDLQNLGYTNFSPANKLIQLELNRLRKKFNDPKPVTASWIYKWSLEIQRAGGDNRAAIPKFDQRGGKGGHRIDPLVDDAITRVINARKTDESLKIRTQVMTDDARTILQVEHPERADLHMGVAWSTVDRRIHETFSEYEICVRNHGLAVAKKRFREWYPRDRAEFCLEVFETDDTDTQVFLIDERTGLPRGRGYLTATVDQNSHALCGWELSDQPRSAWSAISSVVHAILPKDPDHADFAECESGCEFYGKPGIIIFDNALYNHCQEIELAAESMRFIPAWAKPKTPTEKAMIEGWFGLVKSEFLPTQPGFRGSKISRDEIKKGMASANMGWLQFRQALIKWAFDQRANKPLASGWTTRQIWHAGLRFAKPRIPRDVHGFKLTAYLHHKLRFRPEGILLAPHLIYSHPELGRLRKQYGHNAQAQFRYHPNQLESIAVFDQAHKTYVDVPSANPEYTAGLSIYQHRLIRRLAKDNGKQNPSIRELLMYREQLRLLTEQLRHSKKLKERTQSARTGDVPNDKGKTSTAREKVIVMTELEARLKQFDEIEMEEGDAGWEVPNVL
jgi:putative transposase